MSRIATITCCLLSWLPPHQVSAKEDPFVEGEVLITFKPDVAAGMMETTLARHALGLTEHYDGISARQHRICGMIRGKGRTTAQLIADLKSDSGVANVEPNYLRHISTTTPNDPDFAKLWGLANTGQMVNSTTGTSGVDTRFLSAWNLSRTTSSEVVLGIIDTGVDITHPDLAGNIWVNPGEIAANGIDDDGDGYIDDIHGYDFAAATATITDSGHHGTHLAGTIAAVGKNSTGVIGLQYHAKILPLKVSTDGQYMSASAIISACNYVVKLKQKGTNIVAVNASYGGGSYSTSEINAIAALRDVGIIFCAAAGNDGVNNDTTASYPASYAISNIISVAALTQTNGLASFSNYGATTVDLAAPGVNIYSTMPLALAGKTSFIKVGSTTYSAQELTYSGTTTATGLTKAIYNCGIGSSAGNFPAAVSGNIALIQRGTNTFADKVSRAKTAGAVAVIIYNNVSDPLSASSWTLVTAGNWLPALQVTQATGTAILAALPTTATFVNAAKPAFAYQFLDGTSMATPHVTAAAAFAAWNFPSETMAQRISRILNHTTAVAALSGKTTTGGRLDLLNMIDTDGDGLPDWWEMENFNSLAQSAAGDADGDGFANLTEYLSGTNPVSASSFLSFTSLRPVSDASGKSFVLTFPSVADRKYQIEWSDTLAAASWTLLGSTITGTGAAIQITDPNALSISPHRFYRLRVLND